MDLENNKLLITVVGPTAIGKTSLAIALAQYFQTEIISCDSRQFYKEMNIGTAVPKSYELEAVAHHFIQHKSIFESYSVGDFERDAVSLLDKLFKDRNIVIMVGGSGLYVDAVTKGLDEFPEVSEDIRIELNVQYKERGIQYLQQLLKEKDFYQYHHMDIQNPQRVIRALEVCIASGKPYSSFLNKKNMKRSFSNIEVGLTASRDIVYQRINNRVEQMLEKGLLIEAQNLFPYRELNALQTVGYKELFRFLQGDISLQLAVEEIKKNTRHFAKRQYTWFNKNKNIRWFDFQTDVKDVVNQLFL